MSTTVVARLTVDQARRLTERIRLTAHSARESIEKLHALVDEAKAGDAHLALGYDSWTAYLSDVLSDEPLRLGRDQRQELVGYLAGEGMSTRVIAPIVGAARNTVMSDLRQVAQFEPPDTEPVARVVTGRDGKEYKQPEKAKPPRRRPLTDDASSAGWQLDTAVRRIERITEDDRFATHREEIAPHLSAHLRNAIALCQELLNRTSLSGE